MQAITPIILHIPHDSTVIPSEYRQDFLLDDPGLEKEIIAMTDMHTDELYAYDRAQRIKFPVSRLLLDPERFDDDSQEMMAARGMGVLYTVTHALETLRLPYSNEKRKTVLDCYYYPHHNALTEATQKSLDDNDKAIIIDCHSFPSRPLPYEMAGHNNMRAEICIGTDAYHTPEWVRDMLVAYFKKNGFTVSIDDPFAGALTPMAYYRKDRRVSSVMYEIRRDLYMDENTGRKNDNFDRMKEIITASIKLVEENF